MFASRLEQLDEVVRTAEEAIAERGERIDDLEARLAAAREREGGITASISGLSGALDAARTAHAEAQRAVSSAAATLEALRAVDSDVELSNPLVAALAADEGASGAASPTSSTPSPEMESIVERRCSGTTWPPSSSTGSEDVTRSPTGRSRLPRRTGGPRSSPARPRRPSVCRGRAGHAAHLAPARLGRRPCTARGASRRVCAWSRTLPRR